MQELRTLSKNLTLNYKNVIYQIQTPRPSYALRQAQVVVCEDRFGQFRFEGKPLAYSVYREPAKQAAVTSSKQLNATVDQLARKPKGKPKPYLPPPDHPWRSFRIR